MPKENGPFFAALFVWPSYADMPSWYEETLSGYASEWKVEVENGRYTIGADVYDTPSCIHVKEGNNVVGCFECAGASGTCRDAGRCPSSDIYTVPVNTLVREDDNSGDSYYCAPPQSASDYNGFCFTDDYRIDNTYFHESVNPPMFRRGNVYVYYSPSQSSCSVSYKKDSSGYYCSAGYYLSGSSCVKCPNGEIRGIPSFHNYSQARACAPAPQPEECTNQQYNGANYHLSDKECVACPSGAKCDGEYVYCPAGTYVHTTGTGGPAPTCAACPDGGSASNLYTDTLVDCTENATREPIDWLYGHSIGLAPECKWTDEISSDPSVCAQIGGRDKTGTYVFEDSGEYYVCYYE